MEQEFSLNSQFRAIRGNGEISRVSRQPSIIAVLSYFRIQNNKKSFRSTHSRRRRLLRSPDNMRKSSFAELSEEIIYLIHARKSHSSLIRTKTR